VSRKVWANRAVKPEVRQLSVVIPTYRRESALINCVQSILQGSELPSEILIVGREGGTGHVSRELVAQISGGERAVIAN